MAFEEIKAKLGLDVTDFERGVAKAQGSLGKVVDGATSKLGNLKNLGTTIAAAVGFNLESISEGLARMIVGFSKEQEDALNRLVVSSKSAADQMAAIAFAKQGGDDPEKRLKLLDRELESVSQQAKARKTLTLAEKAKIIDQEGFIAGQAVIRREEELLAKNQEEAALRIGQIARERLKAEDDIKKKKADKEKKDIDDIGKSFKDAADEREKRKFNELSLDGKIASKQSELADAQKAANNQTKGRVEQAEAVAKAQQLQSEIAGLQAERTKAIANAEKNLGEARHKNAIDTASNTEKLVVLNKDVADAQKAIVDAGSDQLKEIEARIRLAQAEAAVNAEKDRQSKQSADRIKGLIEDVAAAELKVLDAGDDQNAAAKAQIELQKARKKLSEEQAKITEKTAGFSDIVNDAEKKRAKDISDKIDDLFSRASSLDKALAESKRQAELPTMADVLSGKRDLGSKPSQDIKNLSKEDAKIKRLSDNETRLKNQLSEAKSEADRRSITREGQNNRKQLDEARARRDALLAGLTGKVSDVPFADQEEAAKQARNAAEKAAADKKNAQTIVPPEPIVAPKPIIPAQQALYSAQDQMKKAQNQIGISSKSESGNISGVLNDIKTGINDLNKKLGPSSIK
jgi:hypothetical protein